MKRKTPSDECSFSLVEVVMALGIVSVALVALIGLFSVGLNAGKHASDDTETASVGWQMINQFRSGPIEAGTNFSYLFDYQGLMTTNASEAFYFCTLTTTVAGTTGSDQYLIKATAQITWPYAVPIAQRPNTNIIYATFPHK